MKDELFLLIFNDLTMDVTEYCIIKTITFQNKLVSQNELTF